MLLQRQTPLETRSLYGGTVLSTAVWSALAEPRADHLQIIEALLNVGARADQMAYPTGNEPVDELHRRHGAVA